MDYGRIEMKNKNNIIWKISENAEIPEITAIQTLPEEAGKYKLQFSSNCILKKIIFSLDGDTAVAARTLLKILLRLGIAPEAALGTAKKFYRMTKEFPCGNQQDIYLSSKA